MNSMSPVKQEPLYYYNGTRIYHSEVGKELKRLAKTSITEAVDAVAYLSTDNHLTFNALNEILRTILTLMVKSQQYSDEELWEYTFSFPELQGGISEPELVIKIARSIRLFSPTAAANLLKERSLFFLSIDIPLKALFKIDIEICNIYLKSMDYENAFKALRRAEMNVGLPTEQIDYFENLGIIKEKSAHICINESNPHYDKYLIYSLEAFALNVANALFLFPHLARFYSLKENQGSPFHGEDHESSDDKNDDVVALRQLNIYGNRKEFYREYLDFVYNVMPVLYGIPEKYNQENVNRIFDLKLESWDERQELIEFEKKLKKNSLDEMAYEIYKFVSTLVQKYYDMGNP